MKQVASVLLPPLPDKTLHPCINHRGLNDIIDNYEEPLPATAHLLGL
jgi:hypothetical protein